MNEKEEYTKLGAIIGLGLAYAGSAREDLFEELEAFIYDTNNMDTSAYAALSLGLIFTGKCHEGVSTAIFTTVSENLSEL